MAAGSEYFFRPGAVTSNPARNGPDGRSAGGGALGAGALGAGGGTMEDGGTVDRAPAGERRSGSPRRPRAVELRAAAGESASRAPTSGGTAETDGASAFRFSVSGPGAGELTGGAGTGCAGAAADGVGGVGRGSGSCGLAAGFSEATCAGAPDGFRNHSAATAIPSATTAIATAIQIACPPPGWATEPGAAHADGGTPAAGTGAAGTLEAGRTGAPLWRSLPRSSSAASARATMLLALRSCGLIAAERPASVSAARKFPDASACSA